MYIYVKCWCDVMCSPPIQVLGLHLTYRTPKRVVFDSMPEPGGGLQHAGVQGGVVWSLHPHGNVLM